VKRFRLVAAVGAALSLAVALGGSTAYGGSAQGAPIKIGALVPVTGPFTAWGIQARSGMVLAINEINRKGGVKPRGRGQARLLNLVVADDQSTNTSAGIDGFRRLTEQEGVVAVGGIIGSPIAQATTRLAEEAKVPLFLVKAGANEILTMNSRYTFRTCLPAGATVAKAVLEFAQRRGLRSVGAVIADYAWGQSFKKSLEEAVKATPNIAVNFQVAPVTATNFTPYLRSLADVPLIVATGHPPGAPAILTQSGQLGIRAPVLAAFQPFNPVAKAAGSAAYGRWIDYKCGPLGKEYRALAKRYLKTFPQNEFFEDDALSGYAIVKIVAEAISKVGVNRQRIAAYVHANAFDIPGYAFPLRWTAWGELRQPRLAVVVLTKGPPPEAGLNTAGDWWPKLLYRTQPLAAYRPGS
jgi:branched-chain amino acid transport system substrate-binding protein